MLNDRVSSAASVCPRLAPDDRREPGHPAFEELPENEFYKTRGPRIYLTPRRVTNTIPLYVRPNLLGK